DLRMLRHERQCDDQLVLDQPRGKQAARVELERLDAVRQRGAARSRLYDHELDFVGKPVLVRLETTLARELHGRLVVERDAELTVSALSKSQACSYTARGRVEQTGESLEFRELELSADLALPPRERFQIAQTVAGMQRPGHSAAHDM